MGRYESAMDEMEENTARWLFDKDEYKRWEASEACRTGRSSKPDRANAAENFLWVHGEFEWKPYIVLAKRIPGKPGSGKSFLSSSVIDRLEESARKDKDKVVLFFHFDAGSRTANTVTFAYRSMLSQIFHRFSKLTDMIDRFSFSMAESHGQNTASVVEVGELLDLCLRTMEDRCFIILDGIDECDNSSRSLEGLNSIVSECPSVRLLLFSRPTVTVLNDWIPKDCQVPIADENRDDIQHYLERRIDAFIKRDYLPADVDQERVLNHLTIGANGMFLWAHLMIKYLDTDAIDQESRVAAIFAITMPDDLDNLYTLILQRMKSLNSAERAWASKLFSWLIYAADPGSFQPEALQSALNPTAKFKTEPARFVQTIVRACGSLVELGTDGAFRFVHLSVKEYLCTYLDCLTQQLPAEPLSTSLRESWKLLTVYLLAHAAASHWMHHSVNAITCAVNYNGSLNEDILPINHDAVGDLLETLIPRLHRFLSNPSYFLVWVEISYTLLTSLRASSNWQASLKNLSVYLSRPSCPIHNDDLSQIAAGLLDVALRSEEIEKDWGERLLHDTAIIWTEVAAFHELDSATAIMKVTHLEPKRPETTEVGKESLKTISRVRDDGNVIMVLSVWPSRYAPSSKNSTLRASLSPDESLADPE
jgi:hypothetical protein